jgi:hypothetical protein
MGARSLVDESGMVRNQMGTQTFRKWSQSMGHFVQYHPATVTSNSTVRGIQNPFIQIDSYRLLIWLSFKRLKELKLIHKHHEELSNKVKHVRFQVLTAASMMFRVVFMMMEAVAPLKRRSTIILHGSISQKTTLNKSKIVSLTVL